MWSSHHTMSIGVSLSASNHALPVEWYMIAIASPRWHSGSGSFGHNTFIASHGCC
jgi:hypothetical protein